MSFVLRILQFKESQRAPIVENIEKTKEELDYVIFRNYNARYIILKQLDDSIQEDIKINREIVLQIHKEKELIMKMHRRVDKLKRANIKAIVKILNSQSDVNKWIERERKMERGINSICKEYSRP